MLPTELHALKTSSSTVYRQFGDLAFGSFESIEQPAFPEFAIRESPASSTEFLFGIHREAHTSRRSTRSSSERFDNGTAFGSSLLHASGEFQLSRLLRSGVYRESGRYSRNSFLNVCPEQPSPNHALQRTAPRIAPAMANSEANITSGSDSFVSDALLSLHLLGFGRADTLAAMRRVSPVCPSATMSERVCASLSRSSARRLRTPSVRVPVCLPDGFPPTPKPPFVSQPPTHQDGPLHAAGRSAAWIRTRRSALTRRGWRESERTPNHALQRTAPRSLSLGSLGASALLPKTTRRSIPVPCHP